MLDTPQVKLHKPMSNRPTDESDTSSTSHTHKSPTGLTDQSDTYNGVIYSIRPLWTTRAL